MQRRIAIKRLTPSDLTLFEWHFRNRNAGNQKSINLNADVFIDQLFPALPEAAAESNGRVPLDLNIYGPGHAGLHNLQRKILKGSAYKNWRLNGEYINNPEDNPERYNVLRPDDLAIFEFLGRIVPDSAKLILISQNLPADRPIYQALAPLIKGRSMATVSVAQLQVIANGLKDDDHPFHELALDAELEDAALGGAKGAAALRWRPSKRTVSREELQRARQAAEQVGRSGEELILHYLAGLKKQGRIADFRWEAESNAVAPYDFLIIMLDDQEIALDVKATSGEFERAIHVSYAELSEMTRRRYDLYRVSEVSDTGGRLRIAENVGAFASTILEGINQLPAGVQIDSVSVEPDSLKFGTAVLLTVASLEEPESVE